MEYFLVCYLNSVCWYKSVWIITFCFFGIATCFSPSVRYSIETIKILHGFETKRYFIIYLFNSFYRTICSWYRNILLLFSFIIIINVLRSVLSFSCVLLQNGTCYIYSFRFISLDLCELVTFFFLSSFHFFIVSYRYISSMWGLSLLESARYCFIMSARLQSLSHFFFCYHK